MCRGAGVGTRVGIHLAHSSTWMVLYAYHGHDMRSNVGLLLSGVL